MRQFKKKIEEMENTIENIKISRGKLTFLLKVPVELEVAKEELDDVIPPLYDDYLEMISRQCEE
jgi:hypothetical protein